MSPSPIYNALLRVDGTSGELPSPFERPDRNMNSWILELPDQHLSMEDWCAQTAQILKVQAELLRRLHNSGGRLALFVESAVSVPVLRLEATFLRLLADLGVSLEFALSAGT